MSGVKHKIHAESDFGVAIHLLTLFQRKIFYSVTLWNKLILTKIWVHNKRCIPEESTRWVVAVGPICDHLRQFIAINASLHSDCLNEIYVLVLCHEILFFCRDTVSTVGNLFDRE